MDPADTNRNSVSLFLPLTGFHTRHPFLLRGRGHQDTGTAAVIAVSSSQASGHTHCHVLTPWSPCVTEDRPPARARPGPEGRQQQEPRLRRGCTATPGGRVPSPAGPPVPTLVPTPGGPSQGGEPGPGQQHPPGAGRPRGWTDAGHLHVSLGDTSKAGLLQSPCRGIATTAVLVRALPDSASL